MLFSNNTTNDEVDNAKLHYLFYNNKEKIQIFNL